MNVTSTEGLLAPGILQASKMIYDQLRIPFGNTEWRLLLLADGYALLSNPDDYSPDELRRFLQILIRHKKTVLIDNGDARTAGVLHDFSRQYARMEIVDVHDLQSVAFISDVTEQHQTAKNHMFAVLPHGYIRRRAVHQRMQEYVVSIAGLDSLPKQSVYIVGIGPTREMLSQRAIALMAQAPLIVTFDFVYDVIKDIKHHGELHLLDYDWERYELNIERVDEKLALLHIDGYYDVSLIVEGNPEVYDLLSYLSLAGREYHFESIAPTVVLCCKWIARQFGLDVSYPSYVIVSGYNARHGITTQHLALEMDAYMTLDLTCLIIEVYSGDLPVLLRCVKAAQRPKSIFIMMNMFSPQQQIFILTSQDLDNIEWAIDWVEKIKGKFTSLAVVDEERLNQKPDCYIRLLKRLSPGKTFL